MPPPPPSEQALDELLASKEAEWRALQARRTQLQEAALQDALGQLEEARGRLRGLQGDFVYNLQVLEERDRELERSDAALAQARRLEEAQRAEVSELKIEVAKLRQALAEGARQLEDLQRQRQREEQEHHLALQRALSDKSSKMDQQREQCEALRWRLERRLEELDGELALQRQELLLEFEADMRKREQEFQLRADSMSGVALAHELKVKLLNKELAAQREASAQAAASLQGAQAAAAELEGRLQRTAWELRDLAAVKDARIKDLEDKLQSLQLTRKKEEETFRRKHEELDRAARERDAVLVSVKGAHAEQLRALEARVLELQAQCEALELQARRAESGQADALKKKDAAIDKLREEAAVLRSSWDAQVAQLSKEMASKDLRVQSLQEEEVELKAQLARCRQDIGRYQQQLSLAAEREQSLERDKVQLGLDWQRRCASLERDHYCQSEGLIQGLAEAREQAAARLQEAERRLCDKEAVLAAVTLERDQALQALRTHGLLPEQKEQGLPRHQGEEAGASVPSAELQRLREQNTSLRGAVARMRAEMEALSRQVLPPAPLAGGAVSAPQPGEQPGTQPGEQATAAPDYVLALEAEIRDLKCKFKALEEQLGDVPEPPKVSPPHSEATPSVPPAAEATGGAAPVDGACVGSALRRLGGRTRLLNFLVARLRRKVLQEPLEVDEVDQVHLEALELQAQVAELEKHLGTARQGGGEPPGGWRPRAPGPEALGRQGLAAGGPAGAEDPGAQPPQAASVRQLQRKLKEAARAAFRLRQEKEQLLELGNRLRAELGRPAGPPHQPRAGAEAQDPGVAPETHPQRGPALKQLQPPLPAQKQHKISTATCKSACQKENLSPKPQQAHRVHPDSGHHTQGSSLASGSLQDTWKLLDLGSSPSGLTSQDDSAPAPDPSSEMALGTGDLQPEPDSVEVPCPQERTAPPAADSRRHPDASPAETRAAFAIRGVKVEAQAKAKPTRPSRAHPVKPKGCRQPPKIRNYNFKD
ncbi:coiled-coil domain-containing protein 57 [Pteronotus mesoamericanus]|uniref:coiled-coil domain-containing protein 57 n=1 Tax=Pteronotus mesoamericanus TaxID=1884717 RepID=UPI0023EE14A0|nr:coiled-coil domain-containing protein 57 [Pteronotus parnellii mesoamericanus]